MLIVRKLVKGRFCHHYTHAISLVSNMLFYSVFNIIIRCFHCIPFMTQRRESIVLPNRPCLTLLNMTTLNFNSDINILITNYQYSTNIKLNLITRYLYPINRDLDLVMANNFRMLSCTKKTYFR